MAGSYNHVITEEGNLRGPEKVSQTLETGGDVYEAVEEMYGMIWWLADELVTERQRGAGMQTLTRSERATAVIEDAQENYVDGLRLSPSTRGVLWNGN